MVVSDSLKTTNMKSVLNPKTYMYVVSRLTTVFLSIRMNNVMSIDTASLNQGLAYV